MSSHRFYLTYPLLMVFAVSCDRGGPVEPTAVLSASVVRSGSTPTAPSGTDAVTLSENRIDVSWQDNSTNETGFEVHRSTTGPTGTFALLAATGTGVTSYSDAGLTPAAEYCYRVRSFRTTGKKVSYSAFSFTACATTPAPPPPPPPPGPPDAPSAADATPAASTVVDVYWRDNSTNEDGFRVERSKDGGASWATAGTTGPPETTWWRDIDRTTEEPVCYRVIAFNRDGDSPASNTDCTVPPAGPTGLTVMGSALVWSDNSAAEDGYEVWLMDLWGVYYGPDYALQAELIASLPASTTNYSPSGACEGAAFECWGYAVVAKRDNGRSDWAILQTR